MLTLLLLMACTGAPPGTDTNTDPDTDGDTDTDPGTETPTDPLDEEVTIVVLEVDYAPGAEPYTGGFGPGSDVWRLFRTNAVALIGSDKTLVSPSTLGEMQAIDDPGEGPYDVAAILDLAETWRDQHDGGDTATFYALWLDGHFADSSGAREGVIGVSIGDTGVIAMFAPVVQRLGLTDISRAYGEQATLVHELGHAIGLVNNGVPLQSAHHDAEHGAHCTNDDCIMHWTYESPGELATFVAQYVASESTVLFEAECLADVQAARD